MWIPPGVPELASRRSESDYATYGERAGEMRAGDELIASLKPTTEHWYLDTIATDPDLHGQGLGGRLLDHDLAVRDAAGDACALDTHTPENIGFYGRRGFEVIGEGPLGEGIDVYMMFRPAQ
jgi:ribosomal protein S18 acetylase RimI-like enzyme